MSTFYGLSYGCFISQGFIASLNCFAFSFPPVISTSSRPSFHESFLLLSYSCIISRCSCQNFIFLHVVKKGSVFAIGYSTWHKADNSKTIKNWRWHLSEVYNVLLSYSLDNENQVGFFGCWVVFLVLINVLKGIFSLFKDETSVRVRIVSYKIKCTAELLGI